VSTEDAGLRTQLLLKVAENLREVEGKLSDFEKALSELGIQDQSSAKDLRRMIDDIEKKIAILQRDTLTTPEWMKAFGREWPKALALVLIGAILAKVSGFFTWVNQWL
jgi:uncharacterized Zn finger protein